MLIANNSVLWHLFVRIVNFIYFLILSNRKFLFCIKVSNVLYILLVKFFRRWFFFQILSAKMKTFSSIFKFSLNFLLFALHFLLSFLWSLSWSIFAFFCSMEIEKSSYLIKIFFLNFFRTWTIFFTLNIVHISCRVQSFFVGEIFSFWAFGFDILVLSSLFSVLPQKLSLHGHRSCKHFYIILVI